MARMIFFMFINWKISDELTISRSDLSFISAVFSEFDLVFLLCTNNDRPTICAKDPTRKCTLRARDKPPHTRMNFYFLGKHPKFQSHREV